MAQQEKKVPVKKIISGGQTGADQGGLAAGKFLGLKTGGTAPKGWRTDVGRNYTLYLEYGLKEDESLEYPPRTQKNVCDSDGTVLFGNVDTPGTRLTIKYCKALVRPYIANPTKQQLLDWVRAYRIKILNVAGNRERTNPGIFRRTRDFLVESLQGGRDARDSKHL